LGRVGREKSSRGRGIGPQKLVGRAVKVIRAGFDLDRNHSSSGSPEFRRVRGRHGFEFLDCIDAPLHPVILIPISGYPNTSYYGRVRELALAIDRSVRVVTAGACDYAWDQ